MSSAKLLNSFGSLYVWFKGLKVQHERWRQATSLFRYCCSCRSNLVLNAAVENGALALVTLGVGAK